MAASQQLLAAYRAAPSGLTDSANGARAWSLSGTAAVASGSARFGSAGLSLAGSGSVSAGNADNVWSFGTGAFCIELFVRPNGLGSAFAGLFSRRTAAVFAPLELRQNAGLSLFILVGNAGLDNWAVAQPFNGVSLTNSAWNHVALCGDGSALRLYINGTQSSSIWAYSGITASSAPMYVGEGGDSDFGGDIDSFRVTTGSSRYSGSTITPPSSELTTGAGVVSLMNFNT